VTKSFAAFTCVVAVALIAATGVQACGSPGELLADPVLTQKDTITQPAGPKDESRTVQGEK
jgi:hypothetical protein